MKLDIIAGSVYICIVMAYESEIKRINKILNKLPYIFTFKDFISVYNRLYTDELLAAEDLAYYVTIGRLEQVVQVKLSSGTIKEYKNILDIPDSIYDIESGKTYLPIINDISVIYKQIKID